MARRKRRSRARAAQSVEVTGGAVVGIDHSVVKEEGV
jgi:hypothetical protein